MTCVVNTLQLGFFSLLGTYLFTPRGGYNNESLLLILSQISDAYVSLLDRWQMSVEDRKGRIKRSKTFMNYLGIGVDAHAALQVHMLRESKPKLFFSRAANKAWYAFAGAEESMILSQISDAYVSLLDRWQMSVEDRKGRIKRSKTFMNYLGIGVDAHAALQVHMLRESKPKLFFSRAANKAWYAFAGAEESMKSSCADLPQQITLVADGVEIPLPPDSQGIILLNIDSYLGGLPLWSHGLRPRRRALNRRYSEGDLNDRSSSPNRR